MYGGEGRVGLGKEECDLVGCVRRQLFMLSAKEWRACKNVDNGGDATMHTPLGIIQTPRVHGAVYA